MGSQELYPSYALHRAPVDPSGKTGARWHHRLNAIKIATNSKAAIWALRWQRPKD
jgi:hypothetical protein